MFEVLLILHMLGLAAGVGSSFLMAGLGVRTSGLQPGEGREVMTIAGGMATIVGGAGIVLLWLSGIAMVLTTDGLAAAGGPWFIGKLALVVVLSVLVVLIGLRQARIERGGDPEAGMAAIERMSKIVLGLGVAIVGLAVVAFE